MVRTWACLGWSGAGRSEDNIVKLKRGGDIEVNQDRKLEQLRICLDQEVEAQFVTTGFERFRFVHQALPEMALENVDLHADFLGKRLEVPVVINAMTGGTPWAGHINQSLAAAAQATGVAMSVGSQRTAIDDPNLAYSYQVRDVAPDIILLANIGAVQLNYGYGLDQCKAAVEMIGADALVLHLNPLQEALQQGGNTNFAGLLRKIEAVCHGLTVPVVAKEVGFGISAAVASQLEAAGVAAIDVAGAGGTSWSEVERHRLDTEAERQIAAAFSGWGIPTADAISAVRNATPGILLIGSGGVRTGVDVAKALALGADAAGIANPLLRPATISAEAVSAVLKQIANGLRIAMFCTGARTVSDLRAGRLVESEA